MAMEPLDVTAVEQGVGASPIKNVLGKPSASPVSYGAEAFSTTPQVVGNPDGYDASNANLIRVYYDAVLDGGATALTIYLVPMAADPGPGGKPVAAGTGPFFLPAVPVLSDVGGPLVPGDAGLRIDATKLRRCVTLPRPSLAFRVEVASDTPTSSSQLALAIQGIRSEGE